MNKEFSKAKSTGKHFWIRGYFVSTVGLNEKAVREYPKQQELIDKRQKGALRHLGLELLGIINRISPRNSEKDV